MAFFDDAEWLQSHIVNSFITSDDTGLLAASSSINPHVSSVLHTLFLSDLNCFVELACELIMAVLPPTGNQ